MLRGILIPATLLTSAIALNGSQDTSWPLAQKAHEHGGWQHPRLALTAAGATTGEQEDQWLQGQEARALQAACADNDNTFMSAAPGLNMAWATSCADAMAWCSDPENGEAITQHCCATCADTSACQDRDAAAARYASTVYEFPVVGCFGSFGWCGNDETIAKLCCTTCSAKQDIVNTSVAAWDFLVGSLTLAGGTRVQPIVLMLNGFLASDLQGAVFRLAKDPVPDNAVDLFQSLLAGSAIGVAGIQNAPFESVLQGGMLFASGIAAWEKETTEFIQYELKIKGQPGAWMVKIVQAVFTSVGSFLSLCFVALFKILNSSYISADLTVRSMVKMVNMYAGTNIPKMLENAIVFAVFLGCLWWHSLIVAMQREEKWQRKSGTAPTRTKLFQSSVQALMSRLVMPFTLTYRILLLVSEVLRKAVDLRGKPMTTKQILDRVMDDLNFAGIGLWLFKAWFYLAVRFGIRYSSSAGRIEVKASASGLKVKEGEDEATTVKAAVERALRKAYETQGYDIRITKVAKGSPTGDTQVGRPLLYTVDVSLGRTGLGLLVAGENDLNITEINKKGAIPDWNKTAEEECKVQIGDKIISINGKKCSTKAMLVEALKKGNVELTIKAGGEPSSDKGASLQPNVVDGTVPWRVDYEITYYGKNAAPLTQDQFHNASSSLRISEVSSPPAKQTSSRVSQDALKDMDIMLSVCWALDVNTLKKIMWELRAGTGNPLQVLNRCVDDVLKAIDDNSASEQGEDLDTDPSDLSAMSCSPMQVLRSKKKAGKMDLDDMLGKRSWSQVLGFGPTDRVSKEEVVKRWNRSEKAILAGMEDKLKTALKKAIRKYCPLDKETADKVNTAVDMLTFPEVTTVMRMVQTNRFDLDTLLKFAEQKAVEAAEQKTEEAIEQIEKKAIEQTELSAKDKKKNKKSARKNKKMMILRLAGALSDVFIVDEVFNKLPEIFRTPAKAFVYWPVAKVRELMDAISGLVPVLGPMFSKSLEIAVTKTKTLIIFIFLSIAFASDKISSEDVSDLVNSIASQDQYIVERIENMFIKMGTPSGGCGRLVRKPVEKMKNFLAELLEEYGPGKCRERLLVCLTEYIKIDVALAERFVKGLGIKDLMRLGRSITCDGFDFDACTEIAHNSVEELVFTVPLKELQDGEIDQSEMSFAFDEPPVVEHVDEDWASEQASSTKTTVPCKGDVLLKLGDMPAKCLHKDAYVREVQSCAGDLTMKFSRGVDLDFAEKFRQEIPKVLKERLNVNLADAKEFAKYLTTVDMQRLMMILFKGGRALKQLDEMATTMGCEVDFENAFKSHVPSLLDENFGCRYHGAKLLASCLDPSTKSVVVRFRQMLGFGELEHMFSSLATRNVMQLDYMQFRRFAPRREFAKLFKQTSKHSASPPFEIKLIADQKDKNHGCWMAGPKGQKPTVKISSATARLAVQLWKMDLTKQVHQRLGKQLLDAAKSVDAAQSLKESTSTWPYDVVNNTEINNIKIKETVALNLKEGSLGTEGTTNTKVTTGTLKWLKAPGDSCDEGESLATITIAMIDNDQKVLQVTAPRMCTLNETCAKNGQVDVGTMLATVAVERLGDQAGSPWEVQKVVDGCIEEVVDCDRVRMAQLDVNIESEQKAKTDRRLSIDTAGAQTKAQACFQSHAEMVTATALFDSTLMQISEDVWQSYERKVCNSAVSKFGHDEKTDILLTIHDTGAAKETAGSGWYLRTGYSKHNVSDDVNRRECVVIARYTGTEEGVELMLGTMPDAYVGWVVTHINGRKVDSTTLAKEAKAYEQAKGAFGSTQGSSGAEAAEEAKGGHVHLVVDGDKPDDDTPVARKPQTPPLVLRLSKSSLNQEIENYMGALFQALQKFSPKPVAHKTPTLNPDVLKHGRSRARLMRKIEIAVHDGDLFRLNKVAKELGLGERKFPMAGLVERLKGRLSMFPGERVKYILENPGKVADFIKAKQHPLTGSSAQASNPGEELTFQATLQKQEGTMLGIDIDHTDGMTLTIDAIHPSGLVDQRNTEHSDKGETGVIKTGDLITKVNEVSNNVDVMIKEIKTSQDVTFTILRKLKVSKKEAGGDGEEVGESALKFKELEQLLNSNNYETLIDFFPKSKDGDDDPVENHMRDTLAKGLTHKFFVTQDVADKVKECMYPARYTVKSKDGTKLAKDCEHIESEQRTGEPLKFRQRVVVREEKVLNKGGDDEKTMCRIARPEKGWLPKDELDGRPTDSKSQGTNMSTILSKAMRFLEVYDLDMLQELSDDYSWNLDFHAMAVNRICAELAASKMKYRPGAIKSKCRSASERTMGDCLVALDKKDFESAASHLNLPVQSANETEENDDNMHDKILEEQRRLEEERRKLEEEHQKLQKGHQELEQEHQKAKAHLEVKDEAIRQQSQRLEEYENHMNSHVRLAGLQMGCLQLPSGNAVEVQLVEEV